MSQRQSSTLEPIRDSGSTNSFKKSPTCAALYWRFIAAK